MSKICKKRVHENEKINLTCAFKKCPGSLHLTLLTRINEPKILTKLLKVDNNKCQCESKNPIIYWALKEVYI